jgi:hypothetical protein
MLVWKSVDKNQFEEMLQRGHVDFINLSSRCPIGGPEQAVPGRQYLAGSTRGAFLLLHSLDDDRGSTSFLDLDCPDIAAGFTTAVQMQHVAPPYPQVWLTC